MKKRLLPILFCLFSAGAMAQVCHADLTYAANGPGVYPFTIATPNCGDTLGTKTIVAISDTTVSVVYQSFPLDVTIYYDSTRVLSVSNLPPGLFFGTDVDGVTDANNPYGAWVNGGAYPNIIPAVGCVYIHGSEAAWQAAQSGGDTGVYIIQVEYDARIAQTFPDVSSFNVGVEDGTWLSAVPAQFGGGSININVPIDTDPSPQFVLDGIVGDSAVAALDSVVYTATAGAAGYEWTVTGGTIVSGQGTNEIRVIWEYGNPSGLVEVVAGNGSSCEQTESFTITSIAAGIFETATLNTRIYPNPSNGIFNIELKSTDMIDLTLMDLSGKTVLAEQYSGSNHRMDLSDLKVGVYLLKLETREGWAISRVILE